MVNFHPPLGHQTVPCHSLTFTLTPDSPPWGADLGNASGAPLSRLNGTFQLQQRNRDPWASSGNIGDFSNTTRLPTIQTTSSNLGDIALK